MHVNVGASSFQSKSRDLIETAVTGMLALWSTGMRKFTFCVMYSESTPSSLIFRIYRRALGKLPPSGRCSCGVLMHGQPSTLSAFLRAGKLTEMEVVVLRIPQEKKAADNVYDRCHKWLAF